MKVSDVSRTLTCQCLCVQALLRKLLHPPLTLVQELKSSKAAREAGKTVFLSSYAADAGMLSRVLRVSKASKNTMVTGNHWQAGRVTAE